MGTFGVQYIFSNIVFSLSYFDLLKTYIYIIKYSTLPRSTLIELFYLENPTEFGMRKSNSTTHIKL